MDRPPQPSLPQMDPLHPLTSLEWRECGRMPVLVGMLDAQAVVLGNKVYMGRGGTLASECCLHMSDLVLHTWKTIKSPTCRSALTTYKERLMLVGGCEHFTDTPTNQLWVMEGKGTWNQPLPPMPTPRLGASASTVQDSLIVAGGVGSQGELLDVVEVYNGRQWAVAQSLPRVCSEMKSAIHNGTWYLVGGSGQGKEIFCASLESLVASAPSDMTDRVWKTLPEVHHERSSTAVWGGRLMAVGGYPFSSDILSYSPHTQSWVKVGDLPIGLHSSCTTVLPTGELLMVGGYGTSYRIFKGLLRADQFQPATSFDISILERLEVCTGINIFRELAPKCHEFIGCIWLQPQWVYQSWLILSPTERSKRVLEEWRASRKDLLHLPATWRMLFKVFRDLELEKLPQKIGDWLNMVSGNAMVGPECRRAQEIERDGRPKQTGTEEGGGIKKGQAESGGEKEQEGGSEHETNPGACVKQERGVAKQKGEPEEEPLKMKQKQDIVVSMSMLEEKVAKREEQLVQCEETIQMYKERHQKLLQQMESVMAENEQLRKRIGPVEEGALVPVGESTPVGYLRGVDVIGETSLSVTDEAQTFHWAGYGLKLHIPPASLPAGVGQSSIDIKASLAGQFKFPEKTTLVSAVYWLHSPVEFSHPIGVEIQHCATPSDDPSLTFARASHEEPPYKFTALEGGLFPADSCYACIYLNRFSLVTTIKRLLRSLLPQRRYCAHVYYTREAVNIWMADFVITHHLEACITAVREQYSEAKAGPKLGITFVEEEIVLKVPREGFTTRDQWTVSPVTYPGIAKADVDSFKPGQWLPSCQLELKWSGEGRATYLSHLVELQGAKKPHNFFRLILCCESTSEAAPSDVSPPVQRSSHKRTLDHPGVEGDERSKNDPCDISKEEAGPSTSKRSKPSAPPCLAELRAEPELPDFMNLVAAHIPASKWQLVGIQLHLKDSELDCIKVTSDDPLRCFSSVFTLWKRKETRLPLSWWTVLQALESDSVGEQRLARLVRSKLTTPSHD